MRRKLKNTLIPHRGNHYHPHILRHKSLMAALVVVVLLEFMMLLGSFVLPRLGIQLAAVLPSVVTFLTNNARAESKLAEVKINDVLTLAAQAKAEDMATKSYFAHQSPDGVQPWYWIGRAGYQYQYAGENLAVNFTDSEEVVRAWQNSPTHNLNLMSPRYTETGVGIATGIYQGREAVFVVQFFALPERPVVAVRSIAPVPEEVTLAPSPINLVVLGAEIQAPPSPSMWARIVLSPRTYGTYSLLILIALFIAVLVIGWGRHHPKALAYGVVMVVVLAGVIFMNKYLVFPELEII